MDEDKDVQTDVVVDDTTDDTTTPTGDDTTPKDEKTPETQPLTEERVAQMISEATATAKEVGKREMQGAKDREVAEANRKARQAEAETFAYKTSFDSLDDNTKQTAELARLRGESQYRQTTDQQEEAKRQQEVYFQKLDESLTKNLEYLGIAKDDKRIDWGDKDDDLFTGRSKFDASVAKILQENTQSERSKLEKEMSDKFADLESKLKTDLGLESVDKSTSSGVETGDESFVAKMMSGELPITKANQERFDKIRK